jgi:hypothetical protein
MKNFYYIFVHDTEIIDILEQRQEFSALGNYQYVLLSNKTFSNTYTNTIVSKDYELNIEDNKHYLQFTGWYCLGANKIPKTEYVTLLEYDVRVKFNINEIINTAIDNTHLDCYGFSSLPKTNSFLNNDIFSTGLVEYMNYKNINPDTIINSDHNKDWIVTSNVTIKTDIFFKLVRSELFISFLNFLKNNKYSGHYLERFITVFLTQNKYSYGFIQDCVTHYAADSHNTQNRHYVYQKFKNEQLTDFI